MAGRILTKLIPTPPPWRRTKLYSKSWNETTPFEKNKKEVERDKNINRNARKPRMCVTNLFNVKVEKLMKVSSTKKRELNLKKGRRCVFCYTNGNKKIIDKNNNATKSFPIGVNSHNTISCFFPPLVSNSSHNLYMRIYIFQLRLVFSYGVYCIIIVCKRC